MMTTKPDLTSEEGKKIQVEQMFNNIAPKYDFLNHFLSFGVDKIWRRKVRTSLISALNSSIEKIKILDIATGTADLAIELAKIKTAKIEGIDISKEMLLRGKKKICKNNLSNRINLSIGDAEKIPFDDFEFNAATVAFGVRNFENLKLGLQEIYRILKKNAVFIVLEFSRPQGFPFKQIYWLYFNFLLPVIGKLISKNKYAYSYLPISVQNFPDRNQFTKLLESVGFSKISMNKVSFGIATIYIAYKL